MNGINYDQKVHINMKYTRKEAIEWIVNDQISVIEQLRQDGDTGFLEHILWTGFDGYDKYTNKELIEEIYERSNPDNEETITII